MSGVFVIDFRMKSTVRAENGRYGISGSGQIFNECQKVLILFELFAIALDHHPVEFKGHFAG